MKHCFEFEHHTLDKVLEETKHRLYEVRVNNRRDYLENQRNLQQMSDRIESLASRINKILNGEQSRRAALHPYLSTIRSVMAGDSPQYMQTLQAKICQSLHFLWMTDEQLRLMKIASKELTIYIKAKCLALAEEATINTLHLMNRISAQDDANHKLKVGYLDVIKAQNAIIRRLDLLSQTSIGSINLPISGNDGTEGNFVKLDLSRTGEDRVVIKSVDRAKHFMHQMESSVELRDDVNDCNNSILYISPVSVIPKDETFSNPHNHSKKGPVMAPFPPPTL
jgi:hypothetical protein